MPQVGCLRCEPRRPGDDRPATVVPAGEVSWLDPLPDPDPRAIAVARQSLRLALIASLQYLPPRQRAIFILREALSFSAEECAELLDTSVTAIKSGLQRARAQLEEQAPDPDEFLEPTDPRARQLLDGYIAAFERSDATLLVQVLRADATLEATPFREWQVGRQRCIRMLESHVLGCVGDWRMLPTTANGQPAAVSYRRGVDGVLRANGVVVLSVTATGISRVTALHHDPGLVRRFGFAETLATE